MNTAQRMNPPKSFCVFLVLVFFSATLSADDWPNWMGPKHDGVWREKGILKKLPDSGVKFRWRVPIQKGYTGPAVVGGKLFVMEFIESKEEKKDDPDSKQRPTGLPVVAGAERVICIDTKSGKEIWDHRYECVYKISYPEGPRTTPLVDGERVYTLGAMGHLYCFQKETGKVLWQKDLSTSYKTRPPVWGYAAHPRIYGDRLVMLVGGEGSAVVCFDKNSGKEIWKSGTAKEVCYAPPVPVTVGKKTQLIFWADEFVAGIDLENGDQKWKLTFPEVPVQRPAVSIMTPQVDGRKFIVSNFYNGSFAAEISEDGNSCRKLWSTDPKNRNHKTGLNILMGSPLIRDGHVYGFAGKGELRCLKLNDGSQVWEDKQAANAKRDSYFATAFFTPHENRCFIFNDQGELVIAKLSPKGYVESSRAKILEPATFVRGRHIVWSHPAYAEKCLFARNSKELVCVELAAPSSANN